MSQPLNLGFPVDFQEAIEWARRRGIELPQAFYNELSAESRWLSFTVSGLSSLDQIQHVLDALTRTLEDGKTFADWKAEVIADPSLLSLPKGRLSTIFRTNTQSAYEAGRWEQFERNKSRRGYLLFDAINDGRTTAVCRHLDGIIRPVDDPLWDRYAPLNHFNCRSTLISLTEEQARSRSGQKGGKTYGLNQPEPTEPPADGFDGSPRRNRQDALQQSVRDRQAQCRVTGAEFARKPKAPPIWCGQPGAEYLDLLKTALDSAGPAPEPRRVDVKRLPKGQSEKDYLTAFMGEFGGGPRDTVIFESVGGIRLAIDEMLFVKQSGDRKVTKRGREEYLLYLAKCIQEPDEIWLEQPSSGNPKLHYLARFDRKEHPIHVLAVFQQQKNSWVGVTAYQTDDADYWAKQRREVLIYRRT
jgi:SPP1 gp7 family putative phage head morphogenesis protein